MKQLLLIFSICIYSIALSAQPYADSSLVKLSKIPTYKSLSVDSANTNIQKLLKVGMPNIVMFFSPDCDHCQDEVTKIRESIDSLAFINFILVSNRPPSLIKQFAKEYKISGLKNITYISDLGNNLTRFFGISSNPSMFFYDKNLKCTAGYNSSMVPVRIMLNKCREAEAALILDK